MTEVEAVPVQRHEEGQISRPDIQVPELPINQEGRAFARAGKQEVQAVRVTVGDGNACMVVGDAAYLYVYSGAASTVFGTTPIGRSRRGGERSHQ